MLNCFQLHDPATTACECEGCVGVLDDDGESKRKDGSVKRRFKRCGHCGCCFVTVG